MIDLINDESREGEFMDLFERSFAPRLGLREEGFRTIFKNLSRSCPVIVETGCLRALGNWSGDGQSTFMFDIFAQKSIIGKVYSIDTSPESIITAQQVLTEWTTLILGEGVVEIDSLLNEGTISSIDLLYLDSFDAFRDVSQIPGPLHYLLELCAARPGLDSGTIIAIDDYAASGQNNNGLNKGQGVDIFLSKIGAEVLYEGYQKIWRIR